MAVALGAVSAAVSPSFTLSASEFRGAQHLRTSAAAAPLRAKPRQLATTRSQNSGPDSRPSQQKNNNDTGCWLGPNKSTGAKLLLSAAIAGSIALGAVGSPSDAFAVLNKFEAETRGEFGIGSAAQYGAADLRKTVHKNENFRRANFTSADLREADFSGSVFAGGYLEKAVAYKTNFEGADFTDALMDRMVLNEANLTDAVLVRVILTRSDLGGAVVDGADFSDAILDLPQKQALCKYAKGENSVTGMDTRRSLGCGNRRGNAYGSPSAPLLSDAPKKFLTKDGFCSDDSGLCKASF